MQHRRDRYAEHEWRNPPPRKRYIPKPKLTRWQKIVRAVKAWLQ